MLKDLIFGILRPFLTAYALIRYGSIWGLKEHLMRRPSKLLRLTYGHFFLQRGSFVGLTSEIAGVPCFPHGIQGIFISNTAKLGKDVVIFQQVTIGSNNLPDTKSRAAQRSETMSISGLEPRSSGESQSGTTAGLERMRWFMRICRRIRSRSARRPGSSPKMANRSTIPTARPSMGWITFSKTAGCTERNRRNGTFGQVLQA